MFRNLRLKLQPEKIVVDPGRLSGERLAKNPYLPITLAQLNRLPDNIKIRIFRNLIPPSLLTQFNIDPITWKGSQESIAVQIKAEPGTGVVWISARTTPHQSGEFFCLEIADNAYNGIDLNLILLNDPIQHGTNQLVADLSQVEFMSSAGLRAILVALREARQNGGDLRLAAAQPGVEKTLKMSGFTSIMKAYPSVGEALSSFTA